MKAEGATVLKGPGENTAQCHTCICVIVFIKVCGIWDRIKTHSFFTTCSTMYYNYSSLSIIPIPRPSPSHPITNFTENLRSCRHNNNFTWGGEGLETRLVHALFPVYEPLITPHKSQTYQTAV